MRKIFLDEKRANENRPKVLTNQIFNEITINDLEILLESKFRVCVPEGFNNPLLLCDFQDRIETEIGFNTYRLKANETI